LGTAVHINSSVVELRLDCGDDRQAVVDDAELRVMVHVLDPVVGVADAEKT
jgi:hypothetical protein